MPESLDIKYLTDGELDLILEAEILSENIRGYVPSYEYNIHLHDSTKKIGRINLRIGNNENIFYGGNIGYIIDPEYRGKHFAAKACEIVKKVALAHGMDKLTITCNPDNYPSRRTCERIGAQLMEIVDLPPHNDLYGRGERQKCRYEWIL